MKFSAAITLAASALFLGNANAFAPISSATAGTELKVMREMMDTEWDMGTSTGRYSGYDGYGYRQGGMDYYPRYGMGGAMTRAGQYTNRYGYPVEKVEGNSRRTFDLTFNQGSSMVQLETDGRPLNANVEVWQGPDNTPAKMKLYSEDGSMRPWTAGFAPCRYPNQSHSTSMTVDNKGSAEFPLYVMPQQQGYMGSSRRYQSEIHGNNAQKSFPLGNGAYLVEIWSDSFPFFADVEVWDGPNNIKQKAEIYSESGWDRPWSAIIESPTRGGTIQIRNVGPLEYPLRVSVEPIGGGY